MLEQYIVAAILLTGIIVAVGNWRDYSANLNSIIPVLVVGFLCIMSVASLHSIREIGLKENLLSISLHSITLVRNGFLGALGLYFLKVAAEEQYVVPWEDSFFVLRSVPPRHLFSFILAYTVYSLVLLKLTAPSLFSVDPIPIGEAFESFLMSTLLAINEELCFRLFIIGVLIVILKRWKHRWTLSILISSMLWSYDHWHVQELGFIKFIQILPFGLVLGYTLKKYGYQSCIMLHIITNLVLIVTSWYF